MLEQPNQVRTKMQSGKAIENENAKSMNGIAEEGYNETFEAGTQDRDMSAVEKEIEDFMAGSYVPSFEVRETRIYEFDKTKTCVVDATDFDGKPCKKIQYMVRNAQEPDSSWKKWRLNRKHRDVWDELKKGYKVLSIRREGTAKKTVYIVKGIR